MKWSQDQTVTFVKIYLEQECMWNPNHDHYGHKYLRKEAYRNIITRFEEATGIKLMEREVMLKVKSLASTYTQEMTKIKERSDSDLPYKPAMKWFQYWHRLKNGLHPISENSPETAATPDDQQMWLVLSENEDNVQLAHSPRLDPLVTTLQKKETSLSENDNNEQLDHCPVPDPSFTTPQKKGRSSNITKWGEDLTHTFVKIYLQNEILWNTNHTYFKHKQLRKVAYGNICSQFYTETGKALSVADAIIKAKRLKSTYTQELAKIKRLSNECFTHVPKLKWFAEMDRCFKSISNNEIYTEVPNIEIEIHTEVPNLEDQIHTEVPNLEDQIHTEVPNLEDQIHTEVPNLEDQIHTEVPNLEGQNLWVEVSNAEDEKDMETKEIKTKEAKRKNIKAKKQSETSKTKWTDSDTVKFVKIYLQYDFLYDPKHKYFRRKKLRQEGYSSISSELEAATGIKLDEKELKAKIKTLGSTYIQELSKIKKRSGTEYPYLPKIKWFKYWHRHKYTMQQRNRSAASETQEPTEDWPMSMSEDEGNLESDIELDNFNQEDSESECEVKCESQDNSEQLINFVDTNSDLTREDEFEHYGKYVASVLRRMDLDKAVKIQLQIQNLLSGAH